MKKIFTHPQPYARLLADDSILVEVDSESTENILVHEMGNNLYQVICVPYMTNKFSLFDVLKLETINGEHVIDTVFREEKYANVLVRLSLDAEYVTIMSYFKVAQICTERITNSDYALAVPVEEIANFNHWLEMNQSSIQKVSL